MGLPAAVPAVLSVASAGFSLAGAASSASGQRTAGDAAAQAGEYSAEAEIARGKGTQVADEYQAQRLKQQAEYGRLKATQTDAQMGENLNIALGNIQVARAAGGVDPTSPTTAALQSHNEMVGDRQKNITVANIQEQAAQNESDAAYMRYAGDQALSMSYLGAQAARAGGLAQQSAAYSAADATMLGGVAGALGSVGKAAVTR